METAVGRIGKQAEFYRGYLDDDRSLGPVAGVLLTAIAASLLFYLVSLLAPAPNGAALASPQDADSVGSEPATGR